MLKLYFLVLPPEQDDEAYRQAAKMAHPDVPGGSHEKFTELQKAFQEFKEERGL